MPRILLAALLLLGPAIAAKGQQYYIPKIPDDMNLVEFYLVTTATGPGIADRYGHTGIRVNDLSSGIDAVYQWGQYDFDSPGFTWKFFRGELMYSMGIRSFNRHIAIYNFEERSVWQEKLNLTPTQKRRLMERMAWNAQPENRKFQYQYWYRNCATIPRDYLDEVLEGAIRTRFYNQPANLTFRDYVRSNLSFVPGVELSLDIMMNGNIDRPISAWEEMFMPAKLRERLKDMPAVDDAGNPLPGTRLLGPTLTILEFPEKFERTVRDYAFMGFLLWTPLLVAAALFLLEGGHWRRRRLALRITGFAFLNWGVFAGLFGTVLLFNWLASGHPDGWANVNLLVFFPLVDFAYAVFGWRLLRDGEPLKDRLFVPNFGRWLGALHVAGVLALAGFWLGGIVTQDVSRVLLWFGTFSLVITALSFLRVFVPAPATEQEIAPAKPVRGYVTARARR